MATEKQEVPSHSVAFRVTEGQWTRLQQMAKQKGTTVPKLAKSALFEKLGVDKPR